MPDKKSLQRRIKTAEKNARINCMIEDTKDKVQMWDNPELTKSYELVMGMLSGLPGTEDHKSRNSRDMVNLIAFMELHAANLRDEIMDGQFDDSGIVDGINDYITK